MKPPRFEYFRPSTAKEAVDLLAGFDGEARCLAGGQSLIPLLNFRVVAPAALIDLSRCVELDYVRREGITLTCGAMTRQSVVEDSELVRACCPLLSLAMPFLGPRSIRHRGTIGGTMAHADRVAELPAVAVALGAEFVAEGPIGRRTVRAEEFFLGDLTTGLRPDELLREIRFPIAPADGRVAFVEASNRSHDLALIGIAVSVQVSQGRFERAAIAVHGIGPRPQRMAAAEEMLQGEKVDNETISAAARMCLNGLSVEGDNNTTEAYRRHVSPGLLERALFDALHKDLARPQ